MQIVDTAGIPVNTYEYDEWGNILNQTETIANDFKYAGEMLDSESGFYYLRARYYDPTIGRFISKDSYEGSITNPLSLNLYTYCINNPAKYVDPSGNVMIFAEPIDYEKSGKALLELITPDPSNSFDMTCQMFENQYPQAVPALSLGIIGRKTGTKSVRN